MIKRFYYRFRFLLLALALGLASVSFFKSLYKKWNEIPVDLPKAESESPFFVFPKSTPKPFIQDRELIDQPRDLLLYDYGGEQYDCNYADKSKIKPCLATLKESRKFILKHWQSKTRGYIHLSSSGIDSVSNSRVFIEPDKNGEWHIVWLSTGTGLWDNLSEQEKYVHVSDVHSLKLIRAAKHNRYCDTGKYYLSFSDKYGIEIETW